MDLSMPRFAFQRELYYFISQLRVNENITRMNIYDAPREKPLRISERLVMFDTLRFFDGRA